MPDLQIPELHYDASIAFQWINGKSYDWKIIATSVTEARAHEIIRAKLDEIYPQQWIYQPGQYCHIQGGGGDLLARLTISREDWRWKHLKDLYDQRDSSLHEIARLEKVLGIRETA